MTDPVEDLDFLNPEEVTALRSALGILDKRRRVILQIVPEKASDELCMRISTWVNFILDTGLLPPMLMIGKLSGDGLTCPYCAAPITASFAKSVDRHLPNCEWRMAIERWAFSQGRIDQSVLT